MKTIVKTIFRYSSENGCFIPYEEVQETYDCDENENLSVIYDEITNKPINLDKILNIKLLSRVKTILKTKKIYS